MSSDDGTILLASSGPVELRRGDITKIRISGVINAANTSLSGGAGVNGLIQASAGPSLLTNTRASYPSGCPTGSAVITSSHSMKNCNWIIHAVGPDYRQKGRSIAQKEKLLESVYRSCLEIAEENGLLGIAFPTISTGIFGFPRGRATEIALGVVRGFLEEGGGGELERIVFLVFGEGSEDEREYLARFGDFFPTNEKKKAESPSSKIAKAPLKTPVIRPSSANVAEGLKRSIKLSQNPPKIPVGTSKTTKDSSPPISKSPKNSPPPISKTKNSPPPISKTTKKPSPPISPKQVASDSAGILQNSGEIDTDAGMTWTWYYIISLILGFAAGVWWCLNLE